MGKAAKQPRSFASPKDGGKWTLLMGGASLGSVLLLPVPGPAYLLGILTLVLGFATGRQQSKGENQRILGIVLAIIGILVQTVYLGIMFFHPGKG